MTRQLCQEFQSHYIDLGRLFGKKGSLILLVIFIMRADCYKSYDIKRRDRVQF